MGRIPSVVFLKLTFSATTIPGIRLSDTRLKSFLTQNALNNFEAQLFDQIL